MVTLNCKQSLIAISVYLMSPYLKLDHQLGSAHHHRTDVPVSLELVYRTIAYVLHRQALEVGVVDENYDLDHSVQHRHISTDKPSNGHGDKKFVHYKSSPISVFAGICFIVLFRPSCQVLCAILMPTP
jgi:hypothetical protein